MSWVAVGIGVVGVGTSLYAGSQAKKAGDKDAEYQRRAGESRRIAANLEASVLEQQAGNTIGAAQRDKIDLDRQTRLTESRAIALAAASGGGASSAPGIVHLVGEIAREGSYNSARALYAGMEKARLERLQAKELRDQGEFAVVGSNIGALASEQRGRAGEMKGFGSALETGSSLYTKYGGGSKGADTAPGTSTPTRDFYYSGNGINGDYQYG